MRSMYASFSESNDKYNALADFGRYFETHIRFEERELFPRIENTLTDIELIEIGHKGRRKKKGVN